MAGCAVALACAAVPPPLRAPPGSVRGHLVPAPDAPASPNEALLVFLEPLEAAGASPKPGPAPVLRADEEGLGPAVIAVPVGQGVRFENASDIYHRIFSYSASNPFDLGVLRRGESRPIALRRPGVVPIYCSLHPGERSVVFVAPSPHFATFRPPDPYEIRDVPPGRYRLHAWGESTSAPSRALTVPSGESVVAEIAPRPAVPE